MGRYGKLLILKLSDSDRGNTKRFFQLNFYTFFYKERSSVFKSSLFRDLFLSNSSTKSSLLVP